jgi:hypothetical protein
MKLGEVHHKRRKGPEDGIKDLISFINKEMFRDMTSVEAARVTVQVR